jgi:hypothetical protein
MLDHSRLPIIFKSAKPLLPSDCLPSTIYKTRSMDDLSETNILDPSPMEMDCSSDVESTGSADGGSTMTKAPTIDDVLLWREVSALLDENRRGKFDFLIQFVKRAAAAEPHSCRL